MKDNPIHSLMNVPGATMCSNSARTPPYPHNLKVVSYAEDFPFHFVRGFQMCSYICIVETETVLESVSNCVREGPSKEAALTALGPAVRIFLGFRFGGPGALRSGVPAVRSGGPGALPRTVAALDNHQENYKKAAKIQIPLTPSRGIHRETGWHSSRIEWTNF